MPSLKLEQVNIVLLEEKSNIRVLVKGALRDIGFGNIFECKNVDRARSLVEVNSPDLLILDLDMDHEAVCKLINDVRQKRIGTNPFVVVIGLTWIPESTVVKTALDAGTDDVVKKPISAQILIERVINLIENRKEFIATPDYVGPRRGEGVRPESEDEVQIEAPNSLRQKATGKEQKNIDAKEIARAAYVISLQRVNGLAADIAGLAGTLKQQAAENGGELPPGDGFQQIGELVTQIQDVSAHEEIRNLPRLVSSLSEFTANVARSAAPTARQMMMLRLHAEAIAAALRGEIAGSDDVASALGEARTLAG